jgi:DNA-binding NarL/FixJ family response regulator
MREALVAMLQDHREFAIVGEAANGAEAVELASQLRPDVVIMDVNMPDMDGVEATRRIKRQFPEIQIVALSMLEEDSGSRLMLNAGASAYLPKDGPSGELFARIRNLRQR